MDSHWFEWDILYNPSVVLLIVGLLDDPETPPIASVACHNSRSHMGPFSVEDKKGVILLTEALANKPYTHHCERRDVHPTFCVIQ